MNQKIFIGSSSEPKSLKLAKCVAQGLEEADFVARRWWEAYPAGSITLDRLREIENEVDGAVLLFSNDDQIWYRDTLTPSARDNVILEYGIFVSHLGRHRTVIVREAGVKLPTDLAGITYQAGASESSIMERVVDHFNSIFNDIRLSPLQEINLVVDPETHHDQMYERLFAPETPHIRDLYFGLEGAKAWLAVISDPSYSPRNQEIKLHQAIMRFVNDLCVRSFVSLGPGDGETDHHIASALRSNDPWVQYVPVDISDGLLQLSIKRVSRVVEVPKGIIGDFEARMNFIKRQLDIHAPDPSLYSLLGATFGNFENERQFFSDIKNVMKTDDRLLIDFSLAGKDWVLEKDRGNTANLSERYQRFFAQGIARRTSESIDQVYSSLNQRLCMRFGISEVEDTKTIEVFDKTSNRRVYLFRRYKWDKLLKWCEGLGFKILENECIMPQDDLIGDGVLLLSK